MNNILLQSNGDSPDVYMGLENIASAQTYIYRELESKLMNPNFSNLWHSLRASIANTL